MAIVGAGPTGMMLAAELRLAGVDGVILERRSNHELDGSRAGGLHSRAIELLDQRGAADRFLTEGQPVQITWLGETRLVMSDFPTRHPYGLALWQKHIERIMAGWIGELGELVRYDDEVTGFAQDEAGVEVELADGGRVRARYLVGCDGGRSGVRKWAGIDFPGAEATIDFTISFEGPDEDGWIVARVLEVPGAMSQGRTRGEARENALDALRTVLTPDEELAGETPEADREHLRFTAAA